MTAFMKNELKNLVPNECYIEKCFCLVIFTSDMVSENLHSQWLTCPDFPAFPGLKAFPGLNFRQAEERPQLNTRDKEIYSEIWSII